MIPDNSRVRRQPDAAWRKIDEQVAIVTPGNGMLHLLNFTGSFLWETLAAPMTAAELAAALCKQFDVDATTAQRDVDEFIELMLDKAILEKAASSQ